MFLYGKDDCSHIFISFGWLNVIQMDVTNAFLHGEFEEENIFGWNVIQMDVTNTFLHGEFEEEIYISISPGYDILSLFQHILNQLCKLLKSLYALNKLLENDLLNFTLIRFDFVQVNFDQSLLFLSITIYSGYCYLC